MRKEAHKIIKMEIKRSFTVDQVWDILGNRYGEAHLWATGLYHAEGYGAPQYGVPPQQPPVGTK